MNIKTIMLGPSGVGKTKFLNHLRKGSMKNYCPTVGVDYIVYNYKDEVNLRIWDTSGSSRFRNVVDNFIRGIDLCIFVYNDINTFEEMMELLSYVKKHHNPKRYCILAFECSPLGKQVADKYGYFFFNVNINDKEECISTLKKLCICCKEEQNRCNFLNMREKLHVEKKRDSSVCWFSFC